MTHARTFVAAGLALAAPVLDAFGALSPSLDGLSFAAFAALPALAVLSLPGGGSGGSARDDTLFAAAVLAPAFAVAVVADARAGIAIEIGVARASVGLALALALHASALRAGAAGRTAFHVAAWLAVMIAAPALVVALESAAGLGAAPDAVGAVASFSPLSWAAGELPLDARGAWSDVARPAWRPALGAALLVLASFGRRAEDGA